MSDILDQAKEAVKLIKDRDHSGKCISTDYADFNAATLLPELISEIERLQSREKSFAEMSQTISNHLKKYVIETSERMNWVMDEGEVWIDRYEKLEQEIAVKDEKIKDLEAMVSSWKAATDMALKGAARLV